MLLEDLGEFDWTGGASLADFLQQCIRFSLRGLLRVVDVVVHDIEANLTYIHDSANEPIHRVILKLLWVRKLQGVDGLVHSRRDGHECRIVRRPGCIPRNARSPLGTALTRMVQLLNINGIGAIEGYRPFPVALDLGGRLVPVRGSERSGLNAFRHIELRPSIPVSVPGHEIVMGDFGIGRDRPRIHGLVPDVLITGWQAQGWLCHLQASPHPSAGVVLVGILPARIHQGEVEGCALLPPPLAARHVKKVRRHNEVVLVVSVDLADRVHVGYHCHLVVGQALRNPNGAGPRGI
mmetsp:Transcript_49224/g.115747  ORF Transcript_49224/g.115747 Transcript_49224/m.115747 type:complete len:293 (+) Transcript_49224:236-1114(+)